MSNGISGGDVASAITFAKSVAKVYAESGGDVSDLFAAFVGIVVEQDKLIGLIALQATDQWVSKSNRLTPASNFRD
jgi:hypothetical protein